MAKSNPNDGHVIQVKAGIVGTREPRLRSVRPQKRSAAIQASPHPSIRPPRCSALLGVLN